MFVYDHSRAPSPFMSGCLLLLCCFGFSVSEDLFVLCCRLKSLGYMNLDDLSQFDSQLQLSLAAWGYYYEDYIRLSTGIKILKTTRGSRDQDYEIQLVHSLAERHLNEKWSIGEILIINCLQIVFVCYAFHHCRQNHFDRDINMRCIAGVLSAF